MTEIDMLVIAGKVLLIPICFFGFIIFICWLDTLVRPDIYSSPQKLREEIEKIRPSDHKMLTKMYAQECKERGQSRFSARNDVEHYLEQRGVRGNESGFATQPHERAGISERYREDMARRVVDSVYGPKSLDKYETSKAVPVDSE